MHQFDNYENEVKKAQGRHQFTFITTETKQSKDSSGSSQHSKNH